MERVICREAKCCPHREICGGAKEHWNTHCEPCPFNKEAKCIPIKEADMPLELGTENDVFDVKDKEYGDLMPVADFLQTLETACIICADGCGNYVKDGKGYESPALSFTPYTFKRDVEEHGFTHVLWFNK